MRRIARAARRLEDSIAGDVLGVMALFALGYLLVWAAALLEAVR